MTRRKPMHWMIAASFLATAWISASPANAQIRVFTLSVPSAITSPTGGFSINYSLGGAVLGTASVRVNFYLSSTSNGRSGVALLYSVPVSLRGSGAGPYYPPSGTRSAFIHPVNLTANARSLLQAIADACQAQNLFVLADVNGATFSASASTVMGTAKLPDFTFSRGSVNPSTIVPGGTTDISFDLTTPCMASAPSTVGIFLTDAALNPLAFIGTVGISPGSGTWSLPPTPLTFSTAIPPNTYNILFVADLDRAVAESNEANNAAAFGLTVLSGAALSAAPFARVARAAADTREVAGLRHEAQSRESQKSKLQELEYETLQELEYESNPGYFSTALDDHAVLLSRSVPLDNP